MKKLIKAIKYIWKRKILRILSLSCCLALIIGIVVLCTYQREEDVNTDYLVTILEKSSELTSAKLHYTGISEFKDTGLPIINKADFIMLYEAVARVGIDIKDVKIETDSINRVVWITIPKAKVFDVHIEADTIKYFDEKFAILNVNEKEDSNKAIALAEQKATEEINGLGVLEMADTQAETLIKGLLSSAIPKKYAMQFKR